MTPLPVVFVAKATVLLCAAAVVDLVLRRRGSAAARHLVWTMAVAGLLALPIASLSLPGWTLRIPVARSVAAAPLVMSASDRAESHNDAARTDGEDAVAVADGASSRASALTWPSAILALYIGGVLLLLARLAIEPIALRRLVRGSRTLTDAGWTNALEDAARELRVTRGVRLLQSAREIMPLTFGTLAPAIVLPASADEWTGDRRRAVLLHELAHVARRDCLVQRLTSVACAIYWPHPGVWWAARRLRAERELACDDRVLASGAGPREYAGHLLDLAHSLGAAPAPATALGMARPNQLERRLLAVLDAARNRAAIHPRGRTVAVAIAIVVLIPLAALHAALVVTGTPPTVATTSVASSSQNSAPAGQSLTGTWELRLSRDPGMAQVTIRTEHGNHGRSVRLDQIPGISAEQISAASANVNLSIRRQAGTFTVDGVCRRGVCGGTFSFEPSDAFAAELVKRRFARPTPQQQMDLALADVGTEYLDALEKAGYAKPALEDVVRAAQHGVDAAYLRDMTAFGYRVGTLDALTRLRDHGVDPQYVRGMADSGFSHLSIDELLKARDHGVDPQYMKGMRDLGYRFDDIDAFVKTRDHGIDPQYVGGMASLGYGHLTMEQLLRARDHGVDPHYVREIADTGYKGVALDQLIRMRDHGVDAAFVRRVQQKGLGHPSVDELIERRDRGMDDPDAAARAVAAQVQSLWHSIVRWLNS